MAENLSYEDLNNIVTFQDEDGMELSFEMLDLIAYEGAEYVVLLPLDSEDDQEVVILKVYESEDDPEMDVYESIEDETVLAAVFEIFKERFEEEFEFEDE